MRSPQPQPSSGSATYSLTRLPAISMSRWPETEQWVVLHEYHILVTRLLGWVLVNGVYVHEEGGFQKLPFPFPHHELRRPWQNQKSVPSWEAKQCPQESQTILRGNRSFIPADPSVPRTLFCRGQAGPGGSLSKGLWI